MKQRTQADNTHEDEDGKCGPDGYLATHRARHNAIGNAGNLPERGDGYGCVGAWIPMIDRGPVKAWIPAPCKPAFSWPTLPYVGKAEPVQHKPRTAPWIANGWTEATLRESLAAAETWLSRRLSPADCDDVRQDVWIELTGEPRSKHAPGPGGISGETIGLLERVLQRHKRARRRAGVPSGDFLADEPRSPFQASESIFQDVGPEMAEHELTKHHVVARAKHRLHLDFGQPWEIFAGPVEQIIQATGDDLSVDGLASGLWELVALRSWFNNMAGVRLKRDGTRNMLAPVRDAAREAWAREYIALAHQARQPVPPSGEKVCGVDIGRAKIGARLRAHEVTPMTPLASDYEFLALLALCAGIEPPATSEDVEPDLRVDHAVKLLADRLKKALARQWASESPIVKALVATSPPEVAARLPASIRKKALGK
jgi:hypothetical protein